MSLENSIKTAKHHTHTHTYEHKGNSFASKILLISQTALLQTLHTLHTELRLDMLRSSHYIQWSLCNHSV